MRSRTVCENCKYLKAYFDGDGWNEPRTVEVECVCPDMDDEMFWVMIGGDYDNLDNCACEHFSNVCERCGRDIQLGQELYVSGGIYEDVVTCSLMCDMIEIQRIIKVIKSDFL